MNENLKSRFVFIFDLDGVLINTSPYHFNAWKLISNKFDFEFTESFNHELKGFDRMQSIDMLSRKAGLNLSDAEKIKLAKEKNELYLSNISTLNEKDIFPGVETFLKEAIRIKIPLGIGSGGKNTETLLAKTGLSKYFDVIIDGNQISKPKPDPEIFLTVAQKLAYSPQRCIVFEDSIPGVSAGKKAGMYVVGLGNSQYLKNADLVFANLLNIRAHEIVNWFSIL